MVNHAAVDEVAEIGRPHPDWREVVEAFVMVNPNSPVTEQELDTLCLEHIARFKRQKKYQFVESLPWNNCGKVLKTALREKIVYSNINI